MIALLRPKVGPINRPLITAGMLLVGAYALSTTEPDGWHDQFGPLMLILCAAALVGVGARRMRKDFLIRKALAVLNSTSTSHGSAREATNDERAARGMSEGGGDLLGIDDHGHAVFQPAGTPNKLIEGPPGSFKTISYVIPSIFNHAAQGRSVVVPDVKGELAATCGPALEAAGHTVLYINPDGQHLALIRADEVNLYQPLVDAIHSEGSSRRSATKIASDYASIHYPLSDDAKNPYFVLGSQRIIRLIILLLALLDPAKCTPSGVAAVLADPSLLRKLARHAAYELEGLDEDDFIVAELRAEARNLLQRWKDNPENFGSFIEGATQRFLTFSQAGRLAGYGSRATTNLRTIRERQVIVFVIVPVADLRDFAPLVSLINFNVMLTCKATPNGHPVHIIGEEALNFKFHDLASDLEVLRQLRVTIDLYIQSFAGFEKAYGRDTARAIESYCDVRLYLGVNSFERAKMLSDAIADETRRRIDPSFSDTPDGYNLGTGEFARRLMTPDEIMALAPGRALVFVRGMRFMNLRTVHYGHIHPIRDMVRDSPLSGMKLYGDVLVTMPWSLGGAK